LKRLALVALFMLTSGFGLIAAPLCTSFTNLTAATLQAQGLQGCQFGDKIFYNFTYSYNLQQPGGIVFAGDVDSPAVDGSSVAVQFSNLGGNILDPVISLIGTWQVTQGIQGDIRLQYDVMAPQAFAMVYSSLNAYGYVTNVDPDNDFPSSILVQETVCCPGGNIVAISTGLVAPITPAGLTFMSAGDGISYVPTEIITVRKDVFIDAGTGANMAILTRIDQGLMEMPEPVSFFLLGSGLVTIGLLCMRKKKARGITS
jgi:hypothetical protein